MALSSLNEIKAIPLSFSLCQKQVSLLTNTHNFCKIMGNKAWGAGHDKGVDDGYDMAKDELKEKTGLDFDKLMKIGDIIGKILGRKK